MEKKQNIETAIKNFKDRLIRKAKKNGIWENFGQEEVSLLESMYQYKENDKDWSKIRSFDHWCMTYTG